MKKTGIIYISKHGTTEKVARLLADKLGGEAVLISLKQDKNPDITSFDAIILGTPVYAGVPRKAMTKFCEQNKDLLLQKTTGLFVCGMHLDPDSRNKELIDAYPEYLRQHAKATGFLGGEFLFEKLNFFEKLIIKKVSKVTGSVSAIDDDAIEKFAGEMKN